MVAIVAAGLALQGPARADAVDPLRCEAIGVRKASQLYECLGRCERRNAWRTVRFGNAAAGKLAECRGDCEHRYHEAMDRLMTNDFCVGYAGGGTGLEHSTDD